jgi:hypothetical protein
MLTVIVSNSPKTFGGFSHPWSAELAGNARRQNGRRFAPKRKNLFEKDRGSIRSWPRRRDPARLGTGRMLSKPDLASFVQPAAAWRP